ncbi:MAG TPA: hypothetical protein VG405_04035 [Solirubrobacteraceae bacterium]|nr:hypothetical protein [Solirubrobacteraceae bacterium]
MDEAAGVVDGALSDELELEEELEWCDVLVAVELEWCAGLLVAVAEVLVVVDVPDEAWCVPAAAAATPPVRRAAPRAMPRVARRIMFSPRARRSADWGTACRRSRSSGAGLR